MKKSSSNSTLQKIHTYAHDIEKVRGAQQTNSTDAKNDTAASPTTEETPGASVPTPAKLKYPTIKTVAPKEEPAEVTVPKKVSVDDTPNESLPEEKEPEKKVPAVQALPENKPEEKDSPANKRVPLIHAPIINKSEETKDAPEKKVADPVKIKSNNTTNKPTRDSTYTATVITDTKHKKNSFWKELLKMMSSILPVKKSKKKNNYTASTPLRKGVVQNATTNTARKTVADYSSLKDRVKARVPEENQTEKYDAQETTLENAEPELSKEFEKTRSELLSSIERDVGGTDEIPSDYPTPTHSEINRDSVTVTPKRTASDTRAYHLDQNDLTWEHYVDHNSDDSIAMNHNDDQAPASSIETQIPDLNTQEANNTQAPIFAQSKIQPIIPGTMTNNELDYQEPTEDTVTFEDIPDSSAISKPLPQATPPQSIPQQKKRNRVIDFISQHTHTFILGGLATASILIVGGIAITSLVAQFNSPQTTQSFHRYFNSSAVYPVLVNPLSRLIITEQITQHNNAIGVSEVILQNNDAVIVSPAVLSQLLTLPLDPSFNASLTDIRFGWYREEPFIVMRYTGDTIARGALLQWERTMYTDVLPLFGKTPAESSLTTVFRDTTIDNTDVRVLYLATGKEALLYGIVAPGHLIITTSEMSFVNLTNNFNPQ